MKFSYHMLLPTLLFSVDALCAADTFPDSFSAEKETSLPGNFLTSGSYNDGWGDISSAWGGNNSSVYLSNNKYVVGKELEFNSGANFYNQSITLFNNSYSYNNTINSIQMNIGDGLIDAQGAEAVQTFVKGEISDSDGTPKIGVLKVSSNGKAFDTTVGKNGSVSLESNAEAYTTKVLEGGRQIIGGSSYAQNNIIDGGLQQVTVFSNAVVKDTLVMNYGQQVIYGGEAHNSHIGENSYQMVGGHAFDTFLYNGAFQTVHAGSGKEGIADSNTTVYRGAIQHIAQGISENAQIHGLQVISGVAVDWNHSQYDSSRYFSDGQKATNATIYADGFQRIQTGSSDNAQVYGTQLISSQKGGWVDNTWVDQEGYIGYRASATNTTIFTKGLQQVAWYGEASNTLIDGGKQVVLALGHISDTTVRNGGSSMISYGAYSTGSMMVEDGSLTMEGGSLHSWTGNLGKGAWAAAVDLQSPSSVLYLKHNIVTSESVATINALTNNGVVSFGSPDGRSVGQFNRLDITMLEGNGTFVMNTNLSGSSGDFLNVSESVSGRFNVRVQDSGSELRTRTVAPYHLIYANGSSADTFVLTNGSVDLGAYKYYLVHGIDSDKDNWYLSPQASMPEPGPSPNPGPVVKPDLSDSTKAVIAMANVTPTLWDAELTTLRTRLGEIRQMHDHENGTWGKYISSRYRVSTEHVDYRQDVNGVMFGGDTRFQLENSALVFGTMASYASADLNASGTNGKADSYGIGLYTTWLHNSGYYVDGVLKSNYFLTQNNPYFNGGRTHGKDHTVGGGLSVEAGKHIALESWFVEPYIQASWFIGDRTHYKLDSGMSVKADETQSLKGETGLTFGKNVALADGTLLQPYARLAVRHEFMKDNNIVINRTEKFTNDLSGTSGKYGLGMTAKLNERWSAWGEVNYEKGQHIETPYSGNLGIRYSF